jgi:CelD/BcsL family acetyltransferase involved in cellulose biosynthesis
MLTIEKITSREGFERLAPEWNTLLETSAANTLTLTYEWLSTWWEVFGEQRELYILAVRDCRELIGIAPLLKRTVQHYGLLPFRRLELLASGEDEADEICSEYLDFILKEGREAEALEKIFEHLGEGEDEWDEILLTDMAGESVNVPILKRLCDDKGTRCQVVKDQHSIYLPLPDTWEGLLETLSRDFRRKILRDRRILDESGGQMRIIDRAEEFENNFETLIRLHQMRWTARGEPGVFSSEKFTRFHRSLAPRLLEKGWISLFTLSIHGEPICALYDFIYNKKMYYYQSGLDAENKLLNSAGLLLRSFAIEKAIEAGLTECDFLKGDINSYKSRWRGQTRSIIQLRLSRQHSKEAIYTTTTRFIDGLRQIKRALKRAAVT